MMCFIENRDPQISTRIHNANIQNYLVQNILCVTPGEILQSGGNLPDHRGGSGQ